MLDVLLSYWIVLPYYDSTGVIPKIKLERAVQEDDLIMKYKRVGKFTLSKVAR